MNKKTLKTMIELQNKEINELKGIVNFLCANNKDEIACIWDTVYYIYLGKLRKAVLPYKDIYYTEKNTDLYSIISRTFGEFVYYYKLDKATSKIVDITEEYEQIIKNKKTKLKSK